MALENLLRGTRARATKGRSEGCPRVRRSLKLFRPRLRLARPRGLTLLVSLKSHGGALSDDRLRIVSAASVPLAEFADAFTESFGGYPYPIVLDAARLARRVRQEQYDLEHSLIAYDGDEAVGVAVLAVRAEAGWVPGLGVVQGRRGQGIGRRLMSALLGRVRDYGLRTLTLEVLSRNVTARRIYEELGMRVVRDLLLMDRVEAWTPARAAKARRRTLKEAESSELLAHFARLHAVAPQWARDLPSLLVKGAMRGLYLGERARPRAYVLLTNAADGLTYLSDLGAADASSARELCEALQDVEGSMRLLNEPEQSLFTAPLLEHGFVVIDRQYEMVLEL